VWWYNRRMLQLHYVRCFVAVAHELHFGRAAARLGLTQPPLSRNIQQLEWVLGVVLLERQQQVVKLTAAGRAFLPEAMHLLEVSDQTELAIRGLSRRAAAIVKLGHVAGAGFSLVPRILQEATRVYPDVDVVLHDLVNADALAALRSGRLDLAIVRAPVNNDGLEDYCIAREPLVAALPANHPLARRSHLSLADFQGQAFIMYRPGHGGYYYEMLSYAFHAAGVTPYQVQQVQHTHTILALVSRGIGLALLPQSTEKACYVGVAYRPVELPAHAVSELHLVWQPGDDFDQTSAADLAHLILELAETEVSAGPLSQSPVAPRKRQLPAQTDESH
jgi:DNA-binding transcriptional LysR family regulator